jgi:hypothetical protein
MDSSENLRTGRPSWFSASVTQDRVMCLEGSNFEIAGTVNSPRHAMQKKEQERHAKMAASRGSLRFIARLNLSSISTVNGTHLDCLEVGGASLVAPSKRALYSVSLIAHSSLCNKCHALTAAA